MDYSLFQTEVTDLKRIFHTYQAGSKNRLLNGDFSIGYLDSWRYGANVMRDTFPGDPGNDCARMHLPERTSDYILQQTQEVLSPGSYLFAFRYLLNIEKGGLKNRGLVHGGDGDAEITLYPSRDGIAHYFFVVLNVSVGGLREVGLTLYGEDQMRAFFLDDVVFARLPVSLLTNGDFEQGNKGWKLSDNAVIHPIPGGTGHHLVLALTEVYESYAEQSLGLSTVSEGEYLVSFTIIRFLSNLAPSEKGKVSLVGNGVDVHSFEFEFGALGRYTMAFIFRLSAEEIAQDLTLRIAKLVNKPGLDSWYIDNVQMIAM